MGADKATAPETTIHEVAGPLSSSSSSNAPPPPQPAGWGKGPSPPDPDAFARAKAHRREAEARGEDPYAEYKRKVAATEPSSSGTERVYRWAQRKLHHGRGGERHQ
ncbi:hypothetical protein JX266_008410 [Neoarthrinium moseri]|nr:hypothetical protein JX266_008410 [Neoarthrinium moseri]